MTERDPVLAAWGAAGTDLTMLPSGVEVRVELPLVADLMARGIMPAGLRAIALRFASTEGVEPSELEREEQARWDELERLLISQSVSAFAWTCTCAECQQRRSSPPISRPGGAPIPEQPFRIQPADLETDPPRINRVDLAALRDMVLRARTSRQVDALSRVAHGQLDEAAAAAIIEAERSSTLEGWSTFRGDRRGAAARPEREGVAGPAVVARDHLGPGGRPRGRRRARAAAAADGDRGAAHPAGG